MIKIKERKEKKARKKEYIENKTLKQIFLNGIKKFLAF